MNIENKTTYNDEIIMDGARILTSGYKKVIGLSVCVLVILAMVLVATMGIESAGGSIIILAVGVVLVSVLGIVRIKRYNTNLIQRLKIVNGQETIECTYIIDGEKIVVNKTNGQNILYHKDIKKVKETGLQYVIIYEGGVSIFVSKAGFSGDDMDLFKTSGIFRKN